MRSPIAAWQSRRRRLCRPRGEVVLIAAVAGAWLAGTAGGLGILASYAMKAPASSRPLRVWPRDSHIPHALGACHLVAFFHPRCPCSSATLSELRRVLARAPADCRVTIAFFAPTSQPPDWGQTSLRSCAESLNGVLVIDDIDAREARLFGAAASGHVVVYGRDDELLFAGGITASRGHEGDNLGEDSVVAALNHRPQRARTTPTFGCEIAPPSDGSPCPMCTQDAPR